MKNTYNKSLSTPDADSFADQVNAQAIRIMFGNITSIAASVTLMITVMVWVMWERIGHVILIAWAVTVFAITLAEIQFGRMFFRRNPSQEETVRWGHYYSFISVANGLSWGSACVLYFVSDSAVLQVFLFTCMVGLATASIIQHSYWIESYYAFTVPLLVLSGLRLFWEGGFAYQGLAVLTLALLAIVIQMARESQKSVLAAIRLRFENLDLIKQLREEKEKAEIASHDKTRFLASASHDLRQPVHALTLFAGALRPELASIKAQTLLGNMERSIEAINQLLSSLLDISKLDAQIVKASFEHFSLHALLNQLDAEYAPQAHSKGLAWQMDDVDLVVYSDQALLEVMLRNLISNALRYTQHGHVGVMCMQQGEEVSIAIVDTGIGIADNQKREIFREFLPGRKFGARSLQGIGLGACHRRTSGILVEASHHIGFRVGKGGPLHYCIAGRKFVVNSRAANLRRDWPARYERNADSGNRR